MSDTTNRVKRIKEQLATATDALEAARQRESVLVAALKALKT